MKLTEQEIAKGARVARPEYNDEFWDQVHRHMVAKDMIPNDLPSPAEVQPRKENGHKRNPAHA
jgi:hypothetical protein